MEARNLGLLEINALRGEDLTRVRRLNSTFRGLPLAEPPFCKAFG
jgi:hypothetical protein